VIVINDWDRCASRKLDQFPPCVRLRPRLARRGSALVGDLIGPGSRDVPVPAADHWYSTQQAHVRLTDAGFTLRVYARDACDTATVVADVLERARAPESVPEQRSLAWASVRE